MVEWFFKDLPDGTYVIPTENGFTSNRIGVEFL